MVFIIGIILGAIVVVFILQNIVPVSVIFLGWHFDGSLAFILLLAILAGMVISWLLSIPDMLRLSDLRSHTKRLENDLEVHRQKLAETEGRLSQAETPVVVETPIVVEKTEIL